MVVCLCEYFVEVDELQEIMGTTTGRVSERVLGEFKVGGTSWGLEGVMSGNKNPEDSNLLSLRPKSTKGKETEIETERESKAERGDAIGKL